MIHRRRARFPAAPGVASLQGLGRPAPAARRRMSTTY